tara:strand:+ start:6 stop:1160 length:1155 start_codon:yes stop_codon:yes gene_type:complete
MSKTGNDPGLYQTQGIFFAPGNFPYGSTVGLSQSSQVPAPGLSPEFTKSVEAGLELGFFKNRFLLNLTAYQTNTTDQIVPINISLASGASSLVTNIGEIQNQGLEVEAKGTIFSSQDFKWDLGLNWSTIKSEVISLADGVDEVALPNYYADGAGYGVELVAAVGQPYPMLKTSDYLRDPEGRVIVGADGDPIQDTQNQYQGKTNPDYILGLNTTFRYKNWSLYAVADYRTGHVFYNNIVDALNFTGLAKHNATSGRQPFVFPNSSYSDGNGGYIANTNRLTTGGGNAFWDDYGNVKSNYVTDATTLKLREVSLNYTFDGKTLDAIGANSLVIGVYGRNLLMFRPKDNVTTDPEFNFTTGNSVGFGTQDQTAPTRQFGMSVNVTF